MRGSASGFGRTSARSACILDGMPPAPRRATLVLLFAAAALTAASQDGGFENAFRSGTEALRAGRLDEAATDFQKCTALQPEFAEAYVNLGLTRLEQQRFEDAASALGKAVELKPALRGAHLFLGIALYRLNKDDAALQALRRETQIDSGSASALMWAGIVELAEEKPAEAVGDLDKAAQLNPKDMDILYHQGRAHMLLSRDIYERMFNLDPNSWRVHQVLAESFKQADRLEDAIREAQEAIRLKPDEPGLHEQLADIFWKQNHLEQAETEFENELKIDPRNVTAMYKLGVVSIERSKPVPASKMLAEVLRYYPHSVSAHYQLGRALAQMGENEAAVPHFTAVTEQPEKADAETIRQSYYQLSQLYRRLHRPDDARVALDSFLRLKKQSDAQQQSKLQDKLKRNEAGGSTGEETGSGAETVPDLKP